MTKSLLFGLSNTHKEGHSMLHGGENRGWTGVPRPGKNGAFGNFFGGRVNGSWKFRWESNEWESGKKLKTIRPLTQRPRKKNVVKGGLVQTHFLDRTPQPPQNKMGTQVRVRVFQKLKKPMPVPLLLFGGEKGIKNHPNTRDRQVTQ